MYIDSSFSLVFHIAGFGWFAYPTVVDPQTRGESVWRCAGMDGH